MAGHAVSKGARPSLRQRWLAAVRNLVLRWLRPGKDEAELLEVLGRAEAIRSDEQRDMLEQLVALHDTRVREVMTPRSAIHAIPVEAGLAGAERKMVEAGVSRLPVYEGDLDHIIGIVHAWDVLAARVRSEHPALGEILRPCLLASELEKVGGVLSEMRDKGCPIAIVQDEYGGVAGLVTLSDLIAEVVGVIEGARQGDHGECVRTPDGSWLVHARMHIEDLAEAIEHPIPDGDYDTVGGWITTALGRIPQRGENIELDGLQIRILEVDPRRVLRVRIRKAGS
ncbi:MAG: hemolysin family protein [Mariprofundaceae bacterium]